MDASIQKVLLIMKQITVAFALIVIFPLSCSGVRAQAIQLHFPHFADRSYDWKIFQGKNQITVRSGEIASDGRVTLVMPEAYQDYRGMTRWMLKTGGGLDMIYVGKDFSVECLSEQPNDKNIIYTGNPENDYLKGQHNRQQIILDKLGAINHFLQVYTQTDDLYQTISKEQAHMRRQFEQLQEARVGSPLYAARFGEIVDFTKGVADKVYENPADHTVYFNDFVTHTLKFKELYTSGHWDQVLNQWLMMNIGSATEYAEFKDRLEVAIKRIVEDDILAGFAEIAVPLLVQKGKDDLLLPIKVHLDKHPHANSRLSATAKRMLASFKILTGKKGPDLMFQAPALTKTGLVDQDILLETDKLDADYTLLLFYQGECPLCEDTLIDLANKYQWLKDRNVRVIAISADETEQAFEKRLPYHQWPDNYCDFTGMGGMNFKNYTVLGVPTLYLLDQEGIVLKKTAMVQELLEAVETR
jgi:peroxiredoxin